MKKIALAILLSAGAPAAFAADFMSQDFIKPYDETFSIGLGGIVNQFDTSLRLDGSSSKGTDINLENNGLKKNLSSFEGSFEWRFASRHRLELDYYTVSRSGSHTYTGDINIGGNDYPIGANVNIRNKYDLGSIDYRYSFVQEPDYEIAALVGFYGGKFTFDVAATGLNTSGTTYNKSISTTLPLPLIGLTGDWYLTPASRLGAKAMGMKAKIGDVDGHAYQYEVYGEYMLVRNLGIGARWVYTDIKADVNKTDFDGSFGWRVNAGSLYAKFVF
ncbi:MAG TPA: hypothetical protein VGI57_11760 [Usitatibacter sp.]|jgi:hypothetical protein